MKQLLCAVLVCIGASSPGAQNGAATRFYEGALVGLGANLLVLGRTSGNIHLVAASPAAFTEIIRHTVLSPGSNSMTGPSVAGSRVFVRNSEEIVALTIEGK